jgi:hypothetical protein
MWCVAAAALGSFYWLTFSCNFDDALDTARWIEEGNIARMFEFRHLISRLVPFWMWNGVRSAGAEVSALKFLQLTDFFSAIPAVLLMFAMLRSLGAGLRVALAATFAFGTAWAFWMYVGTGRPYSTSMLFALGAYTVALSMRGKASERGQFARAASAGALALLSCLFWLQQATSCIGAGLVVALWPEGRPLLRRAAYLSVFALSGIVLALAILVSGLTYTQSADSPEEVRAWIAGSGTQPTRLDATSPMKASFGQAGGIIVLTNLSYMINGLLIGDPRLLELGSLPWQLGKFILVWLLALPIYLYAPLAFRRAGPERRVLLFCFFVPLALNGVFALLWLGSDQQRFLPSLPNLVVLGAFAAQDWLARLRRPQVAAGALLAALAFIAAVNYAEGIRPRQREFREYSAVMKQVAGRAGENDFVIFFGRDLSITYRTMVRYFIGVPFVNLNDEAYFKWERADWAQQLEGFIQPVLARGGRVFVIDRLALGNNPVAAAWSEKQRPKPTVKDISLYLRAHYCLTPGWNIGEVSYWQLAPRDASCRSPLDAAYTEARP